MCGILGFVGTPWRPQVRQALETLHSRGPDHQSILELPGTTLAHARLSVIDLAGGAQPMSSPDGRYHLVFNGEIYNFQALRKELEHAGYGFHSRSDTEVLLHGYAAWGRSLLPRLDGMFAFAVWDAVERSLFIARDALGIKPLVYAQEGGGLVFSSTLAPFFALDGFPRRMDAQALRDYLAFQTALAPHTFLASVRSLPPGHCLRYAEGENVRVERWWSIPRPGHDKSDPEEKLAEIDAALNESVRRQLVADVPLGAFLSGGIDSSLMVHYMAANAAGPLRTFCLTFPQKHFDEAAHARAVARKYGCEHHELAAPAISGEDFRASIESLDQPLADPAYVMTHALARLTRRHVTVAISGDGGDELFCGYPRFFDTESRHPRRPGQGLLRRLIQAGLAPSGLLRRSLWGRELLWYKRVELGPWPGRKDMTRFLAGEFVAQARVGETLSSWLGLIDELGGQMDTATLMRADLWTYLSENCLTKTDRASMAHGLEVRVPMLGKPVLDSVLTLPAEYHTRLGGKTLLNQLASRHLPEEVWNRPKHGFSVPLSDLFDGPWKDVCENAIEEAATIAPFLDSRSLRSAWQNRGRRQLRSSSRLIYTLIVILLWARSRRIDL